MTHEASDKVTRRDKALERIRDNIAAYGHHIYTVSFAPFPRYSYTIGLIEKFGVELVLAGATFYNAREIQDIINTIADEADSAGLSAASIFNLGQLGRFVFSPVHESWPNELILGAYDYYDTDTIPALQIKPDPTHWTIDIPDLARPWSPEAEPVWRWLEEPWTLPVPETSNAVTNLAALRGERVTEAARWDEDEWDLFAGLGPHLPEDEARIVPLGTLLGADPSLEPVISLPVGEALWREADEVGWHKWNW